MPQVLWDQSMSVGDERLDAQHREFIEVLNQLHSALMTAHFPGVLAARELALEGMERYVREHFADEEAFMGRIGYPDLAAHRALHEEFAVRVRRLRADVESGRTVLSSDLVRTMLEWIRDHLLSEDGKYAAWAASHH